MMKSLFFIVVPILFLSCGNEVEEITDPTTGIILKKFEYYLDDNGQKIKDGTSNEWYSNGEIRLTENYRDGKREGESIFYQSPDSIRVNQFNNDLLHGKCLLKNSKDVILSVYNYSNGAMDGKMEYNYSNGKKHVVGEYMNGIQTGSWLYFDENENQVAKINFKNGVPVDIVGKWLIEEDPSSFFVFNDDGTYAMWEKHNKYAPFPSESYTGQYLVGNSFTMELFIDLNRALVPYNLEHFDGREMILTYKDVRWVLTKVKK